MKHLITLTALVLLAATAYSSQLPSGKQGIMKMNSFGVGLGIPYGVLGASVDVNVAPKLNVTLGVGTTVLAGIGYNFGLKYFFTPPNRTFRPRVSAYYGVNSMIQVQGSLTGPNNHWSSKDDTVDPQAASQQAWRSSVLDDAESFKGFSLGIGAQWMWGKTKSNGLDFDIMLIATTGLDVDEFRAAGLDVTEPGRVKISIGYRHSF